MKTKKILILIALASSILAGAAPRLFRHVLPGITDIPLMQNGELGVDYVEGTISYKNAGIVEDLRVQIPSTEISEVPEITAIAQTVTFKTAGMQMILSDGKLYSFAADVVIDRVQYSYGLMGVPAVQEGWIYAFAVPDQTFGSAKLIFQMNTQPPISIYRYVGAFYVKANDACVGDECTLNPTLPANCNTGDISGCPQNFGRLIGIRLRRVDNRYVYALTPQWAYVGPGPGGQGETDSVINLPAHAVRVWFQTSASNALFTSGLFSTQFPGVLTSGVPLMGPSLTVSDASTGFKTTTLLTGHEEDSGLFQ